MQQRVMAAGDGCCSILTLFSVDDLRYDKICSPLCHHISQYYLQATGYMSAQRELPHRIPNQLQLQLDTMGSAAGLQSRLLITHLAKGTDTQIFTQDILPYLYRWIHFYYIMFSCATL